MLPLRNGHVRAIRFNERDQAEVTHSLARFGFRTGLPVWEHQCCLHDDRILRIALPRTFQPNILNQKHKAEWDHLPSVEEHAPLQLDK